MAYREISFGFLVAAAILCSFTIFSAF